MYSIRSMTFWVSRHGVFMLMTTVLVGFAAAQNLYGCQVKDGQKGHCHDVGPNGKVQCFTSVDQGFRVAGGAFSPSDFVHMCLGDGGKTCADKSNADAPINGDGSNSCCSCYLYAKYCHGKSGTVTNGGNLQNDEILVMPAAPCTGVEYWDKGGCPKEQIWNDAFAMLPGGPEYGMAINPVKRRGQHQMHIHLAKIQQSLGHMVEKGFRSFNGNNFCVECNGQKSLAACTGVSKPTGGSCGNNPEVTIKKNAKTAADATPFGTVYRDQNGQLNKAALVFRLHRSVNPDTWAIVSHTAGPAECFFTTTSSKC